MVNTRKGQAKPKNEPKTDSLSEKNDMLEQLKALLAAETEKIENSNKRKFDEIAEKLESMGESIAKISKTDDDEKKILSINRSNEKPESAKQFVLKNVINYDFDMAHNCGGFTSEKEEHFNVEWNVYLNCDEYDPEFWVNCNPIGPVGDEWSIDAKLEFKVIEADNINKSVIRTLKCCFDGDNNRYGYDEFMKLEDLE